MSGIYGTSPGYGGYSGYSSYSGFFQPTGMQSAQSLADTYNNNYTHVPRPEHKKEEGGLFGAIKGFAKGFFVNGPINMVKSLFTPQGLLMLAGGIALTVATGGAALPFLVGAGVVMGGVKMASSAMKGDWEGMGEGAFGVAISVAGAKAAPKGFTNAATGEVFSMPAAEAAASSGGRFSSMFASAKNYGNVLLGRTELVGSQGNTMTLGALAKTNAGNFWNTNPTVLNLRTGAGNLRTQAGEAWTNFRAAPGETMRGWYGSAREAGTNFVNDVRSNPDGMFAGVRQKANGWFEQGRDWWSSMRSNGLSMDARIARMSPEEFAGRLQSARSELLSRGVSVDDIATFEAQANNYYVSLTGKPMGNIPPVVERLALGPGPTATSTGGSSLTPFNSVSPYNYGGGATSLGNPFQFTRTDLLPILGAEQRYRYENSYGYA